MLIKPTKIKISKIWRKKTFLLISQGPLMQKIRFLGQKLWPVAREQKDRKKLIDLYKEKH